MTRVFLSYASDDRTRVAPIAEALANAGHAVWWDRRLEAGARFAREIERELDSADIVVVAWSPAARDSPWVLDEASAARDNDRLVPISLDGGPAPLGFRQYQAIDFTQDPNAIVALVNAIETRLAGSQPGEAGSSSSTEAAGSGDSKFVLRRPFLAILAIALLVLVGAIVAWPFTAPDGGPPTLAVRPLSAPEGDKPAQALQKGLAADLARMVVDPSLNLQIADPSEGSIGDAEYRLTGSAETVDGSIHASVRLIGADNDNILWSNNFERSAREIASLRQEIAARVASVVTCVRPSEGANGTELTIPQLKLYLSGCEQWASDMDRAAETFRQLNQLAPDFAEGWLRRAGAEWSSSFNRGEVDASVVADARAAAERALELDPDWLRPHAVIASTMRGPENWVAREKQLALADSVPDRGWAFTETDHIFQLAEVGRFRETLPYAQRMLERVPFAAVSYFNLADTLGDLGRVPEAERVLADAQERFPGSAALTYARFELKARHGPAAEAQRLLPELAASHILPDSDLEDWRTLLVGMTDRSQRASSIETLQKRAKGAQALRQERLMQYLVKLGAIDQAYQVAESLPILSEASQFLWFRRDMAPFRADPRFVALMERQKIAPIWRETGRLPDFCTDEQLPYDCREVFT